MLTKQWSVNEIGYPYGNDARAQVIGYRIRKTGAIYLHIQYLDDLIGYFSWFRMRLIQEGHRAWINETDMHESPREGSWRSETQNQGPLFL